MRRVLQVGAGMFGRRWGKVLAGSRALGVELAGLVDISRVALEGCAKELGLDSSQCFDSLKEALERVRPDVVLCVTPPDSHADIAIAALEAGAHVLVEKPLASGMEDAMRMLQTAERVGRALAVSQNYRWGPKAMAVRETLKSGRLGEPESFTVSFFRGPRCELSYRKQMKYPLLIDMAVHHYDLMRFFLGLEPVWTFARSFNPPWSWFEGDASVAQLIGFDRGVIGTYTASFCSYGRPTQWPGDWRFECTGGVLEWRDDRVTVAPAGGSVEDVLPVNAVYHDLEAVLAAFLEGLDSDRECETCARDNIKSLAVVFKTIESCEKGSLVTF